MPQEGDLRVYWVPQIPCQSFYIPVESLREAHLLLETLTSYDAFQYANNIKPDYCNAGGLEVYENGEWVEWEEEENGEGFDEYRQANLKSVFSQDFQRKLWDCVKLMDTRKGR